MERIDDSREDKWALAEGKYYIRDYEHRSMNDGDFIRFLLSLEWSFDNFSFFFCSLFLLLLFLSISSVSTATRQLKIFFAQWDWIIFERQFSRISFRTWSIGCAYNLEWEWLSVFLWCIFLCVPGAQLVGYTCTTAFNNSWAGICYWVTRGIPIYLWGETSSSFSKRCRYLARKKKIACLPFFFSFFRANVRPTTFHFKQWIFIIALHKSETVSRFLFSNATKFLVRLFSI